jgi:cellobiose phosphorylase
VWMHAMRHGLGYSVFKSCKNSVRTSQETHYVSATKPSRLMLFRKTVAVYCETRTEHTNTLWQNAEFWYVKEGGTYSHYCALID